MYRERLQLVRVRDICYVDRNVYTRIYGEYIIEQTKQRENTIHTMTETIDYFP